MDILLSSLIIIFLGIIVYQDYKFRGISWLLFPIGFVLFSVQFLYQRELLTQLKLFLLNLAILFFVFILLLIYFSIKNRKLTNIVDSYIGIGDLLFFILLAQCFSVVNFVLFINAALLLVIFTYVVIGPLFRPDTKKIPLAGLFALFYLIFYISNIFWLKLNPYSDINITYFYY